MATQPNGATFRVLQASEKFLGSKPVYSEIDLYGSVTGPRTVPAIELAGTVGPETTIVEPGIVEPGILLAGDLSKAPEIVGTIDTTVTQAVLPRGAERRQIIGRPVIEIDGIEIDPNRLVGTFQLTERIDGARSFSFQMPARSQGDYTTGTSFGNQFGEDWLNAWLGAPPGKQDIDVFWIIPASNTYHKVPIVTSGIVENAEIVQSDEGEVWQINCVGKEQRLDRQTVSMEIPPGHGLSLGELIKKIVSALEGIDEADVPVFVPRDDCPIEPRRYKEVILKDDEGWTRANEILSLFNYRLRVDRQGDLTIQYGGRGRAEQQFLSEEKYLNDFNWQLTASDVLADPGIVFTPTNEGPTAVRVSGEEQIVHDDGDSGFSIETLETLVESFYKRKRPPQKILNVAGDLTTTGFTETELFQKISRTRIWRRKLFNAPIDERIEVWGHYNEEDAAGELQNDGTTDWTVGTYIRDGRGVAFSEERWVKLSEDYKVWVYVPYTDPVTNVETLVLQQTGLFKFGFYNDRDAVATVESDGTLDWIAGTDVTWEGEGVTLIREIFQRIETQLEDIWSTEFYINLEQLVVHRHHAPPGNLYYYAKGNTSSVSFEGEREYERITREYQGRGSENHDVITTVRAQHVNAPSLTVTTETGLGGYLPAVPIVDGIKPPEDEYPDGAWASRDETKGFEVIYRSEELEQFRQAYTETLSSSYLENENEALCTAKHIVAEGSTVPVSFHMPLNPLMQPGHRVLLDAGEYATVKKDTYDIRVEETRLLWDWDAVRGHTEVDGKVYVI